MIGIAEIVGDMEGEEFVARLVDEGGGISLHQVQMAGVEADAEFLRAAHDSITGQNTRFRIMTGRVGMIDRGATCEEHLAILQPALAGDWEGAAAALTRHIELARDKAEETLARIHLGEQ